MSKQRSTIPWSQQVDEALQHTFGLTPVTDDICAVCDGLWRVKTSDMSEIRAKGLQGCRRCRLIWEAVSAVSPNTRQWKKAIAQGRIIREVGGQTHLRLGILDMGLAVENGRSQEFIDFFSGTSGNFDYKSAHLRFTQVAEPASIEFFDRLKLWISICESQHSSCTLEARSVLPSRVLNVILEDGSEHVALYESGGEEGTYIALSHCWGGKQPLTTTRSNLCDHKQQIPWTSIPKTFQDAISIARGLGIQYIWIDSLCIIQGDQNDWVIEAEKMGSYYSLAWMTISASGAPNCTTGAFPRITDKLQTVGSLVLENGACIGVRKLPTHFDMTVDAPSLYQPAEMPIFHRGWVFQERLLSRRVLHLGPEEMVWECTTSTSCECGESPNVKHFGNPDWGFNSGKLGSFKLSHRQALDGTHSGLLKSSNEYWHALLEIYMLRSLSFHVDRLPALAGLASQLKNTKHWRMGEYIFGLWSTQLPTSLLWFAKDPASSWNPEAPSWSWASLGGTWTYVKPLFREIELTATLVRKPEEHWGNNKTSIGLEHSIQLSGFFVPMVFRYAAIRSETADRLTTWSAVLWRKDKIPVPTWQPSTLGHTYPYRIALPANVDMSSLPNGFSSATVIYPRLDTIAPNNQNLRDYPAPGDVVFCLNIGTSKSEGFTWSLVLKKSKRFPDAYERIGLAQTQPTETWFKSARRDTFTII